MQKALSLVIALFFSLQIWSNHVPSSRGLREASTERSLGQCVDTLSVTNMLFAYLLHRSQSTPHVKNNSVEELMFLADL